MAELKPTKEQQPAIDYPGSMVAVARPGSGKTFVLARKIRTILEKAPAHQGVVAISYTNKASGELKGRVSGKDVALHGSFFGTVDKFCLGEIVLPFLPHLWGKPEIEVSIDELKKLPEDEQEDFAGLEDFQIGAVEIEKLLLVLQARFLKGQLFLESCGALALYVLKNSVACRRYIKARYSHVIIDEYQDSGREQHELFLKLHELGLVAVAVGDANQSIFEFAHKDSKYLLSLAGDARFKSFPITFNHRCHVAIINYSTAFISNNNAVLLENNEHRVFSKRCEGQSPAIAKWIESVLPKLMDLYDVKQPKDVGILVKTNVGGRVISDALTTKHKLFSGHPLEEHFSLWGRLFAQLLDYRFDTTRTVQEIIDLNAARLSVAEVVAARKILKRIRECDDDDLFDEMEAAALALLPRARKDEALNLLQASKISDLARAFTPAAEDEIQVMSLHKSKGLEFDLVFHLDLYEWVLPFKRPGPGNDFNNPVFPSLNQDTNLHYVGITRARKACFLCYSSRRVNKEGQVKSGNPSEFLYQKGLSDLRQPSPF